MLFNVSYIKQTSSKMFNVPFNVPKTFSKIFV